MTDREKLIALIEEYVEHVPHADGQTWEEACADFMISNGVKVQRWIPVTERLPKPREDVLVCVFWHETYQTRPGWYSELDGMWYVDVSAHWRWDLKVTHWMPLPEPPKEG